MNKALILLILLIAPQAHALTEAEKARLELLRDFSLDDLQEIEVKLDDVFDIFGGIVTTQKLSVATGGEQSETHVPAVTSLITAQDIEASGARNLDEALRMVPGLTVSNYNGQTPEYNLRGLNDEFLILVNGIPIETMQFGTIGSIFGHYPVQAIQRIEIIRGPGSAMYGADAFSGVINIITKTAADIDGTELGLRGGSFGRGDAWLLHGSEYHGWQLAAMLEWHGNEGHDRLLERDFQSLMDEAAGTDASHAPGKLNLRRNNLDARFDLSRGAWRLRGSHKMVRDWQNGAGFLSALDPSSEYEGYRTTFDVTWREVDLATNWDVTAQLAYQDMQTEPVGLSRIFPPGVNLRGAVYPDGVISDVGVSERQYRATVNSFYRGWSDHRPRFGLGYNFGEIYDNVYLTNRGINPFTDRPILPGSPPIDLGNSEYAFIPNEDRHSWFAFIQDTWNFAPGWGLTAGLRHDKYSDFGGTTNPRFALVWETTPRLTSKLLYGGAFLAPNFSQLYTRSSSFMGNPNLKPEQLNMLEWAFNYTATDDIRLALNLFRYEIKDRIREYRDPVTRQVLQANTGEQDGHGGEFELRWKTSAKSSLLFNYAYAKASDENNTEVGNYPRHQAYARGDWLLRSNWYLDAQLNWIGERKRPPGDDREALDGYTTLDLTLRYKDINTPRWNFALGLRNVLDEDVRVPASTSLPNDLPMAGREWFAEIRYRF